MSKTYKDGPIPVEERSCTDCCCFIIFILVTVAMLVVAIYAWSAGNFAKLKTPYDPDGKGCGVDYPNYPYIYFAAPNSDSLWVTTCVSKCPKDGDTKLECQTNSEVSSCNNNAATHSGYKVEVYDSSETAGTFCLPTSTTVQDKIAEALGGNTEGITSLMDNYELVIFAFPIAIVLSLIIMLLVRFTAGCFIYLLIGLTLVGLVGLGIFLIVSDTAATYTTDNKTARIIFAVVCFVLALIILIMVCCFRKRISLASSIIKVSSRFVTENCLIIILPLVLFVIMICFMVLWIMEALGYYSLGEPKHEKHQYPFQHFDIPKIIYALGAFHVFYLFWSLLFLVETGSFIVGGAAVSWYFKRESPYGEASERYRAKHIGSVALGSFFLALLGFLKLLYELLTPEETKEEGCMAGYKKCCDCICCLCTSYLFKCFNNGAYAVINITGDTYCTSAMSAFTAKLNNLGSSTVVSIVQVIFTVLIRLGITFLTVFLIYILASYVKTYQESVTDPTLILVLSGLVAFTIACFFISVYSDAIDAIYTTYLLDVEAGGELNDLCPPELKDFIDEAQEEKHIEN